MKVIYIRDSKSRGYLRIGVDLGDEKKEYTLSEAEYRELGALLVGDEVSDVDSLSLCDMKYRAKIGALRILAYGDNNKSTLVHKLVSKSVDREIAEEIAEEMVSCGYINEKKQLERIIEREANTALFGKRRIVQKLISKGYSRNEIYEVISDLISHGIVDFDKSRQELLEKKLPCDASEEQMRKLLYKYGY